MEDNLKEAVTLFASGMSRPEVVSYLIDHEDRIQEACAEHGEDVIREKMSQTLRSCDPTSNKFAIKKYGEQYKLYRESIKESLALTFQVAVARSVRAMTYEVDKLTEQVEELDHMLEAGTNVNPVGTGEYLSVMNVRNNLIKRQTELQEKLLERLEKMTAQDDPF